MSSKSKLLHVSEAFVYANARAKYYPTADGGFRLAYVEEFDRPTFKTSSGWELCDQPDQRRLELSDEPETFTYIPRAYLNSDEEYEAQFSTAAAVEKSKANERRSIRRARQRAIDWIMCNPDLDAFVTLTLDPGRVGNVHDYDETYKLLRPWLSNRVQRNGLKYVLCHERHKKGGIHMHLICNSSALRLVRAVNVKNGREMEKNGKPLYNVSDWSAGWSTMQYITGENCTEKVALYVLKYITKETGKLGGRYLLSGGALARPLYVYGDSADELLDGEVTFTRAVNLPHGGKYTRYSLF